MRREVTANAPILPTECEPVSQCSAPFPRFHKRLQLVQRQQVKEERRRKERVWRRWWRDDGSPFFRSSLPTWKTQVWPLQLGPSRDLRPETLT